MSREKTNTIHLLNDSLRKGEPHAYQIIFDKYYSHLFSYINAYTKNEEATKDIIQESFINLWNTRDKINPSMSILSYLHKIAYHKFIDSYRKDKRVKSFLDELTYTKINELIEEYDNEKDLVKHKTDIIRSVIEELPPRCKEIFKMSKYDGLKYMEIAKTLNLSIKTVEAQMSKAFALIRIRFKKEGY